MARRKDGDETWFRLNSWSKGQKAAERLAAMILLADGYENVDPSHPLGGRDGKKDILCDYDGHTWIIACYFPRGQKSFSDIKGKFTDDFKGVEINGTNGFVFFTNQEITLGERKLLKDGTSDVEIEIYHLDRIANLLNQPINYGNRLEYLDVEMTKEEQISFYQFNMNSNNEKLDTVLEELMKIRSVHQKYRENGVEDVRSEDDVSLAIDELIDKVWYNRHWNLRYRIEEEGEVVDPEIWKGALASAKKVEEKYGNENLGPWDDFEWGMINGKLSALRWFFGDEWDMLYT